MLPIVFCKAAVDRYLKGLESETPDYLETFLQLAKLGTYKNFTMASVLISSSGEYREVYVHSKLAIVDGFWGSVGSANMVDISFHKPQPIALNLFDQSVTAFRVKIDPRPCQRRAARPTDRVVRAFILGPSVRRQPPHQVRVIRREA